jgi:hypothetical protein
LAGLILVFALAGNAQAAKRADLVVTKASTESFTVKNKGKRKAKKSRAGVFLGDTKVAEVPVKKLKRRKKATLATGVVVPAGTAPGSYPVRVCADVTKVVKEKKEGNNCRSADGVVTVPAPPAPPPAGGGGPPASTPPATTTPPAELADYSPSPRNVTPALAAGAVTKRITPDGGSLSLTGPDGTTYTLTIPAGALTDPEDITMTRIASIAGLPFALSGGVQLGPDGLQLVGPAKLVIDPPAPVPLAERAAFSYLGAGKDLHLYPTTLGSDKLEYELLHFSAYGYGKATEADRRAQAERVPSSREAWARQNLARAQQEMQLAQERGDDSGFGRWLSALEVAHHVWGNEGVRAALQSAVDNDAAFQDAASEYLSWERQRQLLGLGDDALADELRDLFNQAVELLMQRARERCLNNKDPYQAIRMLAIERMRQLLGFSDGSGDIFTDIDKCMRFKLEVDGTLENDTDTDGILGDGFDSYEIRFDDIRPLGSLTSVPNPLAEADPTLLEATMDSGDPDVTWAWNGTATIERPAAVRTLLIDFGQPDDEGNTPPPTVEMGFDWADLREDGTFTFCSGGEDCTTQPGASGTNNVALGALYNDEATDAAFTVLKDWQIETGAGNELFASKQKQRTKHSDITLSTGTEDVTFRLIHAPVP